MPVMPKRMEGNLLKVRYFQERQSACCAYSSPNQDDINALVGFDLYVTNVDVEAPASPEAPMKKRRRIKRFVRVRREIPRQGEEDESSSENIADADMPQPYVDP